MTVDYRHAVGGILGYYTRRIASEATNIKRNFVVKKPEAAAQDSSVTLKRRPRKTGAWREIAFPANPLIFVPQPEVKT